MKKMGMKEGSRMQIGGGGEGGGEGEGGAEDQKADLDH